MTGERLEFADLLAVYSIYLGIRNLTENEQQSDQQLKILRQNDVNSANDKQAKYLLEEISRKFEEQNAMLKKIMEVLKIEGN